MKNLYYLMLLFVLIVPFPGCNNEADDEWPQFNLAEADLISDEEYTIYSLFIEEMYPSSQIIIAQESSCFSFDLNKFVAYYCYTFNDSLNIDSTVFSNFSAINTLDYMFDNKFTGNTNQKIVLLSNEERSFIFASEDINEGWELFYSHFADAEGIFYFSRIGFNDERNQAIFVYNHSYASLGGGGSAVFLEKVDGNWLIVADIGLWES